MKVRKRREEEKKRKEEQKIRGQEVKECARVNEAR